MIKPSGAANYAVSRQGTLFYVPGGVSVQMRRGRSCGSTGRGTRNRSRRRCAPTVPRAYRPTVRAWLVGITDQESTDIWIWDLARETLRRLTFAPGMRWTAALDTRRPADHLHVGPRGRAEPVQPGRRRHRYRRPADDEREPAVPIVHHAGRDARRRLRHRVPTGWRPTSGPAVPLASPASRPGPVHRQCQPVARGAVRPDPVRRSWAEFSPDGRYLAYQSAVSRGERGLRAAVPAGGQRPLADLDGGRDAPRVGAERSRAVLPRCIEYAHRGAGPDVRIDVQRGQAGEGVRRQVCRRQFPPATTTCRRTASGS